MKNIFFSTAVFFTAVSAAFAQDGPGASDVATLNVILNPIQTIEVNAAQKNVNLEYRTISDYANGVSATQVNHLKVYSTGAFSVSVASDANDIARAAGDETISASTIKVKAE